MRAGQTLTQGNAQVALFPMEYLRLTQGRYSRPTHTDYNAYDLAGKDAGKDKWYAPFDIEVVWLDNGAHKTGVVVTNVKRVLMANGKIAEPRTLSIMLWHDNYIGGLRVGYQFKQGVYFYEEGTAGYATGNHIHMELSYWKYDGSFPLFQTKSGWWTLKGTELNIEDLFFVNNTVMSATLGYKFKEYKAPVTENKPSGNTKYKAGDKVTFIKLATSSNATSTVTAGVTEGTIDHVFSGAKYPYRIVKTGTKDSYLGFVNDSMIGEKAVAPKPAELKVGDTVRITATHYATGQKIPNWVYGRHYRILDVEKDKNRARLDYINSYVALNGLVKV